MNAPLPGADGEHVTFCRICEAFCGLVATVRDGRVSHIAPDRANPHSKGHVCVKGVTFNQVTHDPDRVTRPLKRIGPPGVFAPVSWDEALDDIAARLSAIIDRDGADAVASYKGNPIAFATDASVAILRFLDALGVRKYYGAGSQDTNARFAANYLVFGSAITFEVPDLVECDFLVVFGGNPLVSNGSLLYAPRIRHDLDAIAARGRVVVVDPRRTETAEQYEHLPIRPNGDVWLLLGMLAVIIREGLADEAFVAQRTAGWEALKAQALQLDPAVAVRESGIAWETMAALARDFAAAPRAALYGRLGIGRGPFATLENVLLSAINIVTGKFGKPGGANFTRRLLAGSEKAVPGGYGETRSRVGDFPSVARFLASAVMPADISEPGPGQVKALIATGGNVLLAAPGGAALEDALQSLELMISLDFYQNESNRYAHYILPAATFLERDDIPLAGLHMMTRPFVQHTDAVIPPVGEARGEYDIFRALLERMGRDPALMGPRPMELMDQALRAGPYGDHHGARQGWSFERLREHPHGVMMDIPPAYDDWGRIAHADGRFHLWDELLRGEFERLWAAPPQSRGLKLISRRDLRSMNSWLHNVERLARSQRAALLMHPDDARARSLAEGQPVRVWNRFAEISAVVRVSDEMTPGCVCYPHGWGHQGGWRVANRQPGANMNALIGAGPEVVERISGTTIMDGIEVAVEALGSPTRPAREDRLEDQVSP